MDDSSKIDIFIKNYFRNEGNLNTSELLFETLLNHKIRLRSNFRDDVIYKHMINSHIIDNNLKPTDIIKVRALKPYELRLFNMLMDVEEMMGKHNFDMEAYVKNLYVIHMQYQKYKYFIRHMRNI